MAWYLTVDGMKLGFGASWSNLSSTSYSARKLKTTGANLLPGRSILHRLYPLINEEYNREASPFGEEFSPLALEPVPSRERFPERVLEDRLAFGDLPGIAALDDMEARRELLTENFAQL